jgi:hypothetical protein
VQVTTTLYTLPKQFAVGLGILALLPLAVWYGVNLVHAPPDPNALLSAETREPVLPGQSRIEEDFSEGRKRFEEEQRLYFRTMFFVAYPVGVLAFAGGALLRNQAVGAGLMFGGILTLGQGCYYYWDKMGDWLRFGSLLVALALVAAFGLWSYRSR